MTKIFNSDHSRRAMFCTLLSLLMWMVGIGGASAGEVVPRNPIVKIISGPTYSDNGTEVTLKLWMYNYDGDNAHFIGDVYLNIDGSNVVTLNVCGACFPMSMPRMRAKLRNMRTVATWAARAR